VDRLSPALMVALVLLTGCPLRPADEQHREADDPQCIECHFHGDGPRPPGDHWAGDTASTYHDACTHCHPVELD